MMIGGHTSRIGLAESEDGVHFTRQPAPVFYPDRDSQQANEVPGGVEDPRIVEREDGLYVLTYTQWAREKNKYTVGIATSKDLHTWTKYGPAFGSSGKYGALKYKSAGILTRRAGDKLIAAKVQGKYWMYWGEIQIRLATSTDLIHWRPVEDAKGEPVVLMHDRPGLFDSAFPEVGPTIVDEGWDCDDLQREECGAGWQSRIAGRDVFRGRGVVFCERSEQAGWSPREASLPARAAV